jgi:hypothetical protein
VSAVSVSHTDTVEDSAAYEIVVADIIASDINISFKCVLNFILFLLLNKC